MSLFRTRRPINTDPESPAMLFRDLQRHPDIKFLWTHQEKLLEEYYQKHLGDTNVAFELPTGSGKL